tara:strand:- start:883 stop:1635 length:753 start_codon:yes stop_codon:yes gene_type:complete
MNDTTKRLLLLGGTAGVLGIAMTALGRGRVSSVSPKGIIASFGLSQEKLDSIRRRVARASRNLPSDLRVKLSQEIGIPESAVIAIFATETSGDSADKLRFECDEYNERVSSSQRVPCTMPPGALYSKVRSETDKRAFIHAYKINPSVAVAQSSWGAFQVLDPVGKGLAPTAQAWVARWNAEDKWRLSTELLLGWFRRRGSRVDAARQAITDGGGVDAWRPFVKKYNGPGYARHKYHQVMAAAYAMASGKV